MLNNDNTLNETGLGVNGLDREGLPIAVAVGE
jgi:hypothetical protein